MNSRGEGSKESESRNHNESDGLARASYHVNLHRCEGASDEAA